MQPFTAETLADTTSNAVTMQPFTAETLADTTVTTQPFTEETLADTTSSAYHCDLFFVKTRASEREKDSYCKGNQSELLYSNCGIIPHSFNFLPFPITSTKYECDQN